jgi:hypothetical protein
MQIITYTGSLALFFAPDGTVKGGEARRFTGYEKLVAVPDAPGGQQFVFYVTEPEEVVAVRPEDLADYLPDHADVLADAAIKAKAIEALNALNAQLLARAEAAEGTAASLKAECDAQAAVIAEIRAERAEYEVQAKQAQSAMQRRIHELSAALDAILNADPDTLPGLLAELRERAAASAAVDPANT